MAEVIGFLLPKWEACTGYLAPGYSAGPAPAGVVFWRVNLLLLHNKHIKKKKDNMASSGFQVTWGYRCVLAPSAMLLTHKWKTVLISIERNARQERNTRPMVPQSWSSIFSHSFLMCCNALSVQENFQHGHLLIPLQHHRTSLHMLGWTMFNF